MVILLLFVEDDYWKVYDEPDPTLEELNFWMFCLGSWIHHASRRFALSQQTPSRKRSSSFRQGSGGMSSSTSFDQFLERRRSSLSSTLPSMALAHLLEN